MVLLPMILRKWGLQKYRVLSTICKGLLKNRIAHLQKNQRRGMLKAQRKQTSRKGVLNMELTYTNQGDYRLPNLIAPEEPEVHLGKYALLRRSYLKNHRRILFTNLLTSGKLNAHLMEIEEAAQNRMEQIVKAMAAQEGVTEELKASDQMEWVRRMNAIRDSAEEVIRKELITS